MATPRARVAAFTARLSAAGLDPQVTDHDDRTCVETAVPRTIDMALWADLMALLDLSADAFGAVDSSESGLTLWAAIHKQTPAPADAGRGSRHRP